MSEHVEAEQADPFGEDEAPRRRAWPAYLCAAFVLFAIVIEFFGGRGGPAIGEGYKVSLYPATWSTPGRVVWWLAVGVAAGAYRALADYVDNKPVRWWLAGVSSLPFVVYAIAISTSQGWAGFR